MVAKIGVDTAANEPLEVWGIIIQYYSCVSLVVPVDGLIITLEGDQLRQHLAEEEQAALATFNQATNRSVIGEIDGVDVCGYVFILPPN